MKNIFTILILFVSSISFAQDQHAVDSLISVVKNPGKVCKGSCVKDTVVINTYNRLGDAWVRSSPDSAYYYYGKAKEKEDEILKNKKHSSIIREYVELRMAGTLAGMSWVDYLRGNYSAGIDESKKAIAIADKYRNDKRWKSRVFRVKGFANNNLAAIYQALGDMPKALDCYFNALKISEETDNITAQAANNGNLGLVYYNLGDSDKALEYHLKALELNKKAGNKDGEAINYGNISLVYSGRGEYEKALEYSLKCIEINREVGNRNDEAIELSNIANIYQKKQEYGKAFEYFSEALEIHMELGAKYGITNVTGSIGNLFLSQKKYVEAEKYFIEFSKLAEELQSKFELLYAHEYLSDLYSATGRHAKALEEYKWAMIYRDSLVNEENTQARIQNEVQFKYDKKAAEDSVAHANEERLKNAEIEKQDAELKANQLQKYFLYGGLALVIVFSIFMINRFLVIRKQKNQLTESKKIIEEQKHIVEEKHKEITDSINYAERIQRSFLASEEMLNANLKEYFVLFQPKDVVSGDFYWSWEMNGGKFLLACADSTGHGVPGAIMSLLNISSLEKSVERFHRPDEILNETRKIIIERLKKDGSAEGGKDGMDCSLLSFDFKSGKLNFSLANNPLWLVRDHEVLEFSPDKMPVGKHDRQHVSFTDQEIEWKKNDMIYIFTDGYADQFGGEKGKKFKYSSLKKLLVEISQEKPEIQNQKLQTAFVEWKGNLEQIDDVCVIGIRV